MAIRAAFLNGIAAASLDKAGCEPNPTDSWAVLDADIDDQSIARAILYWLLRRVGSSDNSFSRVAIQPLEEQGSHSHPAEFT